MERGLLSNCGAFDSLRCIILAFMVELGLVAWSISALDSWKKLEDFSFFHFWQCGFSITLAFSWLFSITLLCLPQNSRKIVTILNLLCCGPNLFIWSIIGFCVFTKESICGRFGICSKGWIFDIIYFGIFGFSCYCCVVLYIKAKGAWSDLKLGARIRRWRQVKAVREVLIDEECTICLESFVKGEEIRELDCKHEFHNKCIDIWMQTHLTCPLCRNPSQATKLSF